MIHSTRFLFILTLVGPWSCTATEEPQDGSLVDGSDGGPRDLETSDVERPDHAPLACEGESDCAPGEWCSAVLPGISGDECVRGARPAEARCIRPCGQVCAVGPHMWADPNYPRGIMGGRVAVDCIHDAGVAD